jgi:uncharacterized protein YneF (UPF0154 family)
MIRPKFNRTVEIVIIVLSLIVGISLGLFGVEQMRKQQEENRKAAPTRTP